MLCISLEAHNNLFLYNIYNIHTDLLCVDGLVLYVYLCMLLAKHCVVFCWIIVRTLVVYVYIGCLRIDTKYGHNVSNAQFYNTTTTITYHS